MPLKFGHTYAHGGIDPSRMGRALAWVAWSLAALTAIAHEASPVTHAFDPGARQPGPRLELSIREQGTGRFVPARVSLEVDGRAFEPPWVNDNGIRFTSIHLTKRQRFTTVYARGTGPVVVGLPRDARRVEVVVARGLEFVPGTASIVIAGEVASGAIALRRWSDLEARGWIAVENHVHYDRLDPTTDAKWLTMLEADGLRAAHFLVARGGMMPGAWARQFAYGEKGRVAGGGGLLVPGEEYRDGMQGHILLLGIDAVIEPISTGGMGTPAVAENFPPLHDVLLRAKAGGGIAGVAHGGTLSRSPTALADAVLGAVDFWEISNGFHYHTEHWYRLMNCGVMLPPSAGTDLPNHPFRDPWQPLLGSVRTYVNTGGRRDFDAFKEAQIAGRVFVTEGPLLQFTVDGKGPGETVRLPAAGGTVSIRAELRSAQALQGLHLVRDGRPLPAEVQRTRQDGIEVWRIERQVPFTESGWVAATGTGVHIVSLGVDARAHTAAVQILVGERPIFSQDDATVVVESLRQQRELYRSTGRYGSDADRAYALDVFDRAIARLRERPAPSATRSK